MKDRINVVKNEGSTLKTRVEHLEETNRWHMHTLNIIGALCNVYVNPKQQRDPLNLIKETTPYILQVVPFSTIGFCSFATNNCDITVDYLNNKEDEAELCQDLEKLINNGDFSWAIHSHVPQLYQCEGRTLVLAPVATPTRMRGVFIGKVSNNHVFKAHHKKGLHAIIQYCAYALESNELQHVIKSQNENLIKSYASQSVKIKKQDDLDQLTKLPNRKNFSKTLQKYVEHASATGEMLAVVLLNLDLFKRINESLGHDAGDMLLQQVSLRLLRSLKSAELDDTCQETHSAYLLSHFGADEFCILLSDISHLEQLKRVIVQLTRDLAKPFVYHEKEIVQTFSAGISLFPDNATDSKELLRFADIALDQAKKKGRNQYLFYANDEHFRVVDQLKLSRDLHRSLERKEFSLYFQPQINMSLKKVTGVEALIRWFDQEGKSIPPDKFIPLAEDTGLIIPIGNWVVEEACKHLKKMQDSGHLDTAISINIAPQQFEDEGFVEKLLHCTDKYHLKRECIELEITERTVLGNIAHTVSTMRRLRTAGYKIAIDDFGTGYSSLSHIKNLPLDRLKIDKSFISDIPNDKGSEAIVKAITQLAHGIDLQVVAEGVENIKQARFMNSLGCYEIQGYYFCKPLDFKNLITFLDDYYLDTKRA